MKKETICWGCQNYNKCSWAKGTPVKGWEATPTVIVNDYGNRVEKVESFCVHNCPEYLPDRKQKYTAEEIGNIIGLKKNSVVTYARDRQRRLHLRQMLKEKGFLLHIHKEINDDSGKIKRSYYLERVANESN